MAKILCAFSGLEIKVDHFPCYLDSREACHPVFLLPLSKLGKFYTKWVNKELNELDSYLLFLATLKASELVEWRTSVVRTTNTPVLVSQFMIPLVQVVTKISNIYHPGFSIPTMAITPDTASLENIKYWIKTWESSYDDFLAGLKNDQLKARLNRRENALEKLIKSPEIPAHKYAHVLAAWAADAGAFPDFTITLSNNTQVNCSTYWQEIIVKCYNTESIISIPKKDIQEILTHCEDNIDPGTIFSYHLFAALQEGISRHSSFFSIGEDFLTDSEHPGFRVLTSEIQNSNTEALNLAVMVDTAPLAKPERLQFTSEFQYLKQLAKWNISQKYKISKGKEND